MNNGLEKYFSEVYKDYKSFTDPSLKYIILKYTISFCFILFQQRLLNPGIRNIMTSIQSQISNNF